MHTPSINVRWVLLWSCTMCMCKHAYGRKYRYSEAMLGSLACPNTNTGTVTHCAAIRNSNVEYVLPSSYSYKAGYCILTQLYSYTTCLAINLMQDLGRPWSQEEVVHGYYFISADIRR